MASYIVVLVLNMYIYSIDVEMLPSISNEPILSSTHQWLKIILDTS